MEAQHSAHRERIDKTELACYLERGTVLVKAAMLQVVSNGFNRYLNKVVCAWLGD